LAIYGPYTIFTYLLTYYFRFRSGTRIPAVLPDGYPGNKLPGYGSPNTDTYNLVLCDTRDTLILIVDTYVTVSLKDDGPTGRTTGNAVVAAGDFHRFMDDKVAGVRASTDRAPPPQ